MGRMRIYTPEQIAERRRARMRAYYHRNKERYAQKMKEWRERNIEYYYDYVDAYNHGIRINKKEWDKEHGKEKSREHSQGN